MQSNKVDKIKTISDFLFFFPVTLFKGRGTTKTLVYGFLYAFKPFKRMLLN